MRATAAVSADARIPVCVISGFLGSGKTTLLRHVLGSPAFAESLVIVNEFGEVGIDHHLLERSDDRTVLLGNGCVCCELRGDLQELLVDVMMRRRRGDLPDFDRVFIETSGLAEPGPIAQTLYSDRALAKSYRLACVASMVDAIGAGGRAMAADVAQHQLAAADLVIISKADRADAKALREAKVWVQQINPFAPCITAAHGIVDAALFTGDAQRAGASPPIDDDGRPQHTHHDHPPDITSFAMAFDNPVSRIAFDAFVDVLTRLAGEKLLRVKGIVHFDDASRPLLVQGVRHIFDVPSELPRAVLAPAESKLVFITSGLDREPLDALWFALSSIVEPHRVRGR